jgi:hypothetical protein
MGSVYVQHSLYLWDFKAFSPFFLFRGMVSRLLPRSGNQHRKKDEVMAVFPLLPKRIPPFPTRIQGQNLGKLNS